MTKMILTGGAGFIASHIVDRILKTTDWEICVFDKFSYASGGLLRLKEIGAYDNPRVKIHVVDLAAPISPLLAEDIGSVDYLLHLAAGTHVDRSIISPSDFVRDNVLGTLNILEYARKIPNLKRFLYFSTDEVFGPAAEGQKFLEWDRYNSGNPYSATKAGGEELALAWATTYNVPVVITHTMNVIGERQHHEKFLPKVVKAALRSTRIQLHTDPVTGLTASRNYLHAGDVADGVMFLLRGSAVREKYNIAREEDISCLEVVKAVSRILDRPIDYELVNPAVSRPGCDMRYGLSPTKMADMGWTAPTPFVKSVDQVVRWMVQPENEHWLRS